MEKPNKDDLERWLRDPVTSFYKNKLEEELEFIKNYITFFGTIKDTADKTAMETTKFVGNAETLSKVMDFVEFLDISDEVGGGR